MKKSIFFIIIVVIINLALVNSTAITNEETNKDEMLDGLEPVDKIIVAFKDVGGNVLWDKTTQNILGLPPYPFFVYLRLYEGGWIKTYSGEIYKYPEVKTVIFKFFIGDCYPSDSPLQKLRGIGFGLELL